MHLYQVKVRPLVERPPAPPVDHNVVVRIVQPEEIARYAGDPALDLPRGFVQAALARDDVMTGVFDEDVLVAYVWASSSAFPDNPRES